VDVTDPFSIMSLNIIITLKLIIGGAHQSKVGGYIGRKLKASNIYIC